MFFVQELPGETCLNIIEGFLSGGKRANISFLNDLMAEVFGCWVVKIKFMIAINIAQSWVKTIISL
jgi:hypothetical protein